MNENSILLLFYQYHYFISSKMNTKQIGQAIFDSSKPQWQQMLSLSNKKPRLIEQFKRKIWIIQGTDSTSDFWNKFYSMMIVTRCQTMELHQYHPKEILVNITPAFHQNLLHLSLYQNFISSIESISFLNAPNLYYLNLNLNRITQISALNKTNFPHLRRLHIILNELKQISLSRLKTTTKADRIWNQNGQICRIQQNDRNVLAKLETKQLLIEKFIREDRIMQKKIMDSLHRKYPQKELNHL